MHRPTLPVLASLSPLVLALPAAAQVASVAVIDNESPDFPDFADRFDRIGCAVADVGDVDGDGIDDLVAGAWGGDMVQVLFLNADGTVRDNQRIGIGQGGIQGEIDTWFGHEVEPLGDLDGDGVPDVAVGERLYGNNQGAVWILFLNPDGTVKDEQRITEGEGGFGGILASNERLGSAIANIGDLDGDGVVDLAIGAEGHNGFRGAVWIFNMNADGTVKSELEIAPGQAGFTHSLDPEDYFGSALAATPDFDGDGIVDLAVGAIFDDDAGAFWLVALKADGTVKGARRHPSPSGILDTYGCSVEFLGDLSGDGTVELAVGSQGDDDGLPGSGAFYIHSLNAGGMIVSTVKVSATSGGFGGALTGGNAFGSGLGSLGDFDGDGIVDLAVGAESDKDGGFLPYTRGALWLVYLNADGTVKGESKISAVTGGVANTLEEDEEFGFAAALLGDLDGDGVDDLAVGARFGEAAGGSSQGSAWILFLKADGGVRDYVQIAPGIGGFVGPLADHDYFGAALAAPGDVDGDGVLDLVVGAPRDDDGGSSSGALWVLFLNPDGTVKGEQKIGGLSGGFTGSAQGAYLGTSLAPLGDMDGDGRPEVAAGASRPVGGGPGSIWVFELNPDGTLSAEVEIGDGLGGLEGTLDVGDTFGSALASLGDLGGDGTPELAVGAIGDDDGANAAGAIWVLSLAPDGTVADELKIGAHSGNLVLPLESFDRLGEALGTADLDGDGVRDLLVGRPAEGPLFFGGEMLQLFLNADGTVRAHREIEAAPGMFPAAPAPGDRFGQAVLGLGDLDGDGREDFAVGLPGEDNGGIDHGGLWICFGDGSAPDWGYATYGACANPPHSLTVVSGVPTAGAAVQLGVDNPLGTQGAPSTPVIYLATAPDPNYPCGTPIPGLGMAGPGAVGELLISLLPPNPIEPVLIGSAWSGPGTPEPVDLAIPASAALVGLSFFAQGALIDPIAAQGVPVGLTNGIELTIGA